MPKHRTGTRQRVGRGAGGHVDPFYDRRRRYETVLREFGLQEAFDELPRPAQEAIWKRKFPDPAVVFDGSFPGDATLRRRLEEAARDARFDVGGTDLSVRDFLSIAMSLQMVVEHSVDSPAFPESVRSFMRLGRTALRDLATNNANAAVGALATAIDKVLAEQSRTDTRWLTASLDPTVWIFTRGDRQGLAKAACRFRVSSQAAQSRSARLDGRDRPVFRLAEAFGGMGLSWVSWDAQQARRVNSDFRGAEDAEVPVYVQSHALHQLQARVNLPPLAPYLECWMARSLSRPQIITSPGDGRDSALVEFKVKDSRLGYFVVTVVDGIVVVKTFLFLTMQGTPEARALRRKLRLGRDEIDWLRLNDLASFTQTDLRLDEKLCSLLESCGCGHLFTIDTETHIVPRSQAAELRQYLRLVA